MASCCPRVVMPLRQRMRSVCPSSTSGSGGSGRAVLLFAATPHVLSCCVLVGKRWGWEGWGGDTTLVLLVCDDFLAFAFVVAVGCCGVWVGLGGWGGIIPWMLYNMLRARSCNYQKFRLPKTFRKNDAGQGSVKMCGKCLSTPRWPCCTIVVPKIMQWFCDNDNIKKHWRKNHGKRTYQVNRMAPGLKHAFVSRVKSCWKSVPTSMADPTCCRDLRGQLASSDKPKRPHCSFKSGAV